jgi:hypothetical protein
MLNKLLLVPDLRCRFVQGDFAQVTPHLDPRLYKHTAACLPTVTPEWSPPSAARLRCVESAVLGGVMGHFVIGLLAVLWILR